MIHNIKAVFRMLFGPRPQIGQIWKFDDPEVINSFDSRTQHVEITKVKNFHIEFKYLPEYTLKAQMDEMMILDFKFCFKPEPNHAFLEY